MWINKTTELGARTGARHIAKRRAWRKHAGGIKQDTTHDGKKERKGKRNKTVEDKTKTRQDDTGKKNNTKNRIMMLKLLL